MSPALVRRAGAVALLALAACASPSETSSSGSIGGKGPIGAPCSKSEDCPSTLCVSKGTGVGVCTSTCTSDSECPASPNWKCLPATKINATVCGCEPNASGEICGDGVDNDCDGRVDDCTTCNGKTVSLSDDANCGACGNACSADKSCVEGACRCPSGLSDCNGKCTDVKTDAKNCSACGSACTTGQACVAGACSCSVKGDTLCAVGGCTSLQTDEKNCGACGKACSAGLDCVNGSCACPWTGDTMCAGKCTSLQSDMNNCGACGKACTGNSTCVNGACACATTGLTMCQDSCVNTANDAKHCGACDVACAPGETCATGKCKCASGLNCDGACVPATDKNNCGTCGNACGAGQSCSAGKCVCGIGSLNCNMVCVPIATDPTNCGGCGIVCPAAQTCTSGKCACPVGNTFCAASSACVDVKTDVSNCGTCGKACAPSESCVAGVCKCGAGELFCASAGSCVDVMSNTASCGTCDKVCSQGLACKSGLCLCATAGQTYCPAISACASLSTDSANCGACGNVCPTGTHCAGSKCACDTVGQTNCSGVCFDLKTDKNNCGACGASCPGTMVCTAGACGCPSPVLGAETRLTTTVTHTIRPSAAWNGAHVGVVYLEGDLSGASPSEVRGNVQFALLNPDGTRALAADIPLTNEPTLTLSRGPHFSPQIVWTGTEFAVLWVTLRFDNATAYVVNDLTLQRLAPDGTLIGAAVNVSANNPVSYKPYEARLAWSATYGGFAVASSAGNYDTIHFQRIGADGSAPEAVNTVKLPAGSYSSGPVPSILAASDGTWKVAASCSGVGYLLTFNADGSFTLPAATSPVTGSRNFALAQSGTGWATAWGGAQVTLSPGLFATQYSFAPPPPATGYSYQDVVLLATPEKTFDLAWTHSAASGALKTLYFRRFFSNSGGSTSPISDVLTVLATQNLVPTYETGANGYTFNSTLVEAGPTKRLALWSDSRFGAPELYVRAIDLAGCP